MPSGGRGRREQAGLPPLRVATLNTWKGDGAYRQRLELMTAGLRELDPDILLLQEVLVAVDGTRDTAAALASALGLSVGCLPGRRKLRRVEGEEIDCHSGLAVLSRFPIAQSVGLPLPDDPRDGERWCQCVALDVGDRVVRVVNTHLTHLEGGDDLRRAQLAVIVDQVAAFEAQVLTLLGGDFNAEVTSPAMRWLAVQQVLPTADAFAEAALPACANSMNLGEPVACVDHLLRVVDPASPYRWLAAGTALAASRPADLRASDHLVVWGDLAPVFEAPLSGPRVA